jgi:Holliday junction resolvase RusA-like endonuclease
MRAEDIPQVILRTYVPGRPRSKGSLKNWCMKDRRHTIRSEEQVKDSHAWRVKVAHQVQRECRGAFGEHLRLEIPVELRVVYFFDRTAEDRPDEAYPVAMGIGDLDKLDRNIGDALTSSGVIKDDQYIVRIVSEKRWAAEGGQPGAQITLLKVEQDAVLLAAMIEAGAHLIQGFGS